MAALAQRSSQERLWLVGGIVAGLVVAVLGWLLFISPQRSDTSDVNAQAQSVRLDNVSLQEKISTLQAQSKNMTDVKGALAKAQLALPSSSGVPAFLRTLQSLGNSTGTDVVNLTNGAPTPVTAGAPGAPGAAATTPAPTPTASLGAAATPTASVYSIAISAQVNGSTDQLDKFLDKLQSVQPRAVLITQLTEGSAVEGQGNTTSLQLTMQAFVAPATASRAATPGN